MTTEALLCARCGQAEPDGPHEPGKYDIEWHVFEVVHQPEGSDDQRDVRLRATVSVTCPAGHSFSRLERVVQGGGSLDWTVRAAAELEAFRVTHDRCDPIPDPALLPDPDGVRVFCSFGEGAEALARIYLSDGCLGRPDDRLQDVCIQHLVSCAPRGEMEVVGSYALNANVEQMRAFSRERKWPAAVALLPDEGARPLTYEVEHARLVLYDRQNAWADGDRGMAETRALDDAIDDFASAVRIDANDSSASLVSAARALEVAEAEIAANPLMQQWIYSGGGKFRGWAAFWGDHYPGLMEWHHAGTLEAARWAAVEAFNAPASSGSQSS